jgi:hypothetical protein
MPSRTPSYAIVEVGSADDDQASSPSPLPSQLELLTGVPAIAQALGRDEHSTRLMLEAGLLPGFFLGGRWYARVTTLSKFFAELEQQQLARGAAARAARPVSRWQKRSVGTPEDVAEEHRKEQPPKRPTRRTRKPATKRAEAGDGMAS